MAVVTGTRGMLLRASFSRSSVDKGGPRSGGREADIEIEGGVGVEAPRWGPSPSLRRPAMSSIAVRPSLAGPFESHYGRLSGRAFRLPTFQLGRSLGERIPANIMIIFRLPALLSLCAAGERASNVNGLLIGFASPPEAAPDGARRQGARGSLCPRAPFSARRRPLLDAGFGSSKVRSRAANGFARACPALGRA